jgi:hypothetical protein
VRMVSTAGIISTVAGTGTFGYTGDGIAATVSQLYQPNKVYVDAAGNLLIADQGNNRVRKVNTSGIINTIAGTGFSGFAGDGFPATTAKLKSPTGVTMDAYGNLYIADWGNNRIRTLKVPTMVPEVGKAKARLLLYPNPSDGNFSVSVSTDRIEEVEIVVIDVLGKIVLRESGKSNSTIPVSVAQGAGTYFVHAVTSGGEQHSEVVVVR